MSNKLRYSLTGVLILGTIGTIGYKNNWLAVHDSVARYQFEHTTVVSNNHLSISKCESIIERLMKQTHANEGLTKQGFVSVPTVGILQPIFDNAYTNVGLNAGANYANRSEVDPDGKNKPKMGVGNYGVASHNFNDGITGFSALQEKLNDDAPYLQDGQLNGSDWLNGQHVYLANGRRIFDYRITRQMVVKKGSVSVLNPTNQAKATIITFLFPSTDYRIITNASLVTVGIGKMFLTKLPIILI